MTETHLPHNKAVKDLLAELLGRDVTIEPAPPLAPGPDGPCTIAVYVDDRLVIRALAVVDMRLSAHAGAAIGLLPVGVADEAVEEFKLPEAVRENLYEVLNIGAALFNVGDAPHVRLYDVHYGGDEVPQPIAAQAVTLGRRADMAISIAGYGSGRMSIVLV